MSVRDPENWPDFINYQYLETEASKLYGDEIFTFVVGEHEDMKKILIKYKIGQLSLFLEMVFDGPLHDYFFESERRANPPPNDPTRRPEVLCGRVERLVRTNQRKNPN